VRLFDYGRSKVGTGSYSFKKNWGFEPEPLHYEFHLVKARQLPDVNPLNPKYRFFIEAWKRLPLPVSRWLGPFLSRDLG
nr:peptidoglycan bridge formation protein FemAB [Candidatus Competibacteraceae bacterium]